MRLLLIVLLMLGGTAYAKQYYPGQFAQVSPKVAAWYKSLARADGFRCCDQSDCHSCSGVEANGDPSPCDAWDTKDDHFRVHMNGSWLDIPPEKVVNSPNPTGDAVVCSSAYSGNPAIYCFVPGGGS